MDALIDVPKPLSDGELLARVRALASQARETTAALVAHLAEVEARGLHLAAGYGSMPVVLELLAEGALNLTAVKLLSRHLTDANHREILDAARGKSRSEVELLVARLSPQPDVLAVIRKLPQPRRSEVAPMPLPVPALLPLPTSLPVAREAASVPGSSPRTELQPLTPERYKLQLTIGRETRDKLRRAKDLLRHAIPSGDEAEILDRALTLLLAEVEKKKLATTARPQVARAFAAGSRTIPAEVRRAVSARDGDRCAFVGATGRRCDERGGLEFHHVHPHSEGGPPTVDNVELRCRAHNRYEWRLRNSGYGGRDGRGGDQPRSRSIHPPPRHTSPS